MEKRYNYFYKITNLLNLHFYYGIHSTDNLEDGYMGSGHRLHLAYEKYGIENFSKEILKYFDTRQEALNYELEVVNEELIRSKDCYNIILGGRQFNITGLVCVKDENGNKFLVPNDDPDYLNGTLVSINCGRVISEETRLKLAEKAKNRKGIKYKKYERKKPYVYYPPKKLEETQRDTSSWLGEKNSLYNTLFVHKENKEKRIHKDLLEQYVSDGWIEGRIKTIWINNGIKNSLASKYDLDSYLQDGWVLGKIWKSSKIKKNNINL